MRLTSLQRERVLRRTIASLRLEPLAGPAAGAGFARAAGRLIAELEQQRVDPAWFASALKRWAGPAHGARRRTPASLPRSTGATSMSSPSHDRDDTERFAWGALDALRERPASWGATPVFLYGFDDLTPIELDAVETLSQ